MAKSAPWAERSGAERRRTLGRFGVVYGTIALIALIVGWIPVALLFGLGAVALGIGMYSIDPTPTETAERTKPDWLAAMDDPDAPDLSLPEYRTEPRAETEPSPFARPDRTREGDGSRTEPKPNRPPRDPPTPGT